MKTNAASCADNYQSFLKSEYWQEVRKSVIQRDNYACQQCGSKSSLHVHHLTYEHHGEEMDYLDDLVTLCKGCHAVEHGIIKRINKKSLSISMAGPPYVAILKRHTGSFTSALLMQQLNYWFSKYPDGFYKFLDKAPDHRDYREGDSWSEELAFSLDEFRSAFDKIGVRHKSKTVYFRSGNSFTDNAGNEKFFCSYNDKRTGLTWYFRNHRAVDVFLENLNP